MSKQATGQKESENKAQDMHNKTLIACAIIGSQHNNDITVESLCKLTKKLYKELE